LHGFVLYGGCAWGTLACAGSGIRRSVNLCTAASYLFDSMWGAALKNGYQSMLKVVPDPPYNPHSLEDTLIQATDYALCAATVVHQALLLQPRSPASILMMTSMHELEALRALLESALVQVQMPAEPRTSH